MAARNWQTKQLGEFFLDFNDGFGALEIRFQTFNPMAQGGIFICQWIRLRAALFGREGLQGTFSPLLPPMGQVRRIESLRRRRAPIWPASVQVSASSRMRRLYSAEN